LKPIADYWLRRLERLYSLFKEIDEDLIGAFRGFEDRGVIEIISSAATHGFLPLLARDESIQLQLRVGVSEHRRLFGKAPTGCWLPECAYRPAGPWNPGDEWYLGFHKVRWPDGLRLWRVTGPRVDLGDKREYDPQAAQTSARNHADHFAGVLKETAAKRATRKVQDAVVTAPFDAELF